MNRLKDFLLFPVRISSDTENDTGLSGVTDMGCESVCGYGNSFDKTITMTRAALTDMLHVLAGETEISPVLPKDRYFCETVDKILNGLSLKEDSLKATEDKAALTAELINLPARCALHSAEDRMRAIVAVNNLTEDKDLCKILSESLASGAFDSRSFRRLMLRFKRDCINKGADETTATELHELSKLKSNIPFRRSKKTGNFNELCLLYMPADTALKLLIFNIKYRHNISMRTLAHKVMLSQESLDELMSFYKETPADILLNLLSSLDADTALTA